MIPFGKKPGVYIWTAMEASITPLEKNMKLDIIKQVTALLLALVVSGSFLLTGCADDPIAPPPINNEEEEKEEEPPPPPEIKYPTHLIVTRVDCSKWPENKENGDPWDPFWGDPDIFFTMGSHATDVFDDIEHPEQVGLNMPGNGCKLDAYKQYTLTMWDEDGIDADDKMGAITWAPSVWYRKDNAATISFTTFPKNIRIVVYGKWVYAD